VDLAARHLERRTLVGAYGAEDLSMSVRRMANVLVELASVMLISYSAR